MKITKPSELREGMRIKFKYNGIDMWGWAKEDDDGDWHCIGGTGTGLTISIMPINGEVYFMGSITDLESVEGIRAAKEGDVLVDDDGDEYVIVFANDFIVLLSEHDEIFTWENIEDREWKLKDQEQPAKDKEGAWLRNKVAELIGDLIEYDDYPERRKMFRKVQMDINDEIDRLIELVDIRLGADLSNSSDYSIKTIKIDNKIYKLEPID